MTTPSASVVEGIDLVELAEVTDPAAAAGLERDVVREVRDDAGMPALIGSNGADAFKTLDEIQASFGRDVLRDAAAAVEAGLPGRLASVDPRVGSRGSQPPTGAAPAAIDINLFADTGFTANAIMSLYTGLVERAADSLSGTIPREEQFEQTADGLRQSVTLSTRMSVQAGGGRVSADVTMSATDNIFNATTGAFVARYTSTSTGHFDVNACPDRAGIGEGTYRFETKHELTDVGGSTSVSSGAGRSVESPFRLINGDDARLQRIEATMDLAADAHGPGTTGGPGPTEPFDWGATQSVSVVIPRGGGTSAIGGSATVTGTGGSQAGGAMFFTSAMAQLFMGQVGTEAERFWRSGKCIDLKPSRDTGKVAPGEQVQLTVEAIGKFDSQPVMAPIVASFSGKQSLEPAGAPLDPPASFAFQAGSNAGDIGTIEMTQTGVRGIGRKTVEFKVATQDLLLTIKANGSQETNLYKLTGTVSAERIPLKRQQEGQYQGDGSVDVAGRIRYDIPLVGKCIGSYTGSIGSQAYVERDEADPARLTLNFQLDPSSIPYHATCDKGPPTDEDGSDQANLWLLPLVDIVSLQLGIPTRFTYRDPIGSTDVTVTIEEAPPPATP